ncbi:TetR family transcriptional regulator [Streptomyces sp. NPDC060077]|uniref:TetR family transcriptional regulator n=1 Tax=Streptomyces sp. NPDC060077 TaxID=3347052 RepID=UPI00364FB6D0
MPAEANRTKATKAAHTADQTDTAGAAGAVEAAGADRAGGPTGAGKAVRPDAGAPRTDPASPLTERQEARRRRILQACAQLAGRGGFDAVQMREVAESSQVALGTLYRYFPSKIHLLVATMQDQLEHLHATLRKRPPIGATAAERVAETLMGAFRALQREPQLADAMVRALTFADRSVSPEVDQVSRQTTMIILDAMELTDPTPDQLSAVRVIEHTWHSALITWLSGRASIAQVRVDIETACRLVDLTAPKATGTPGAP